MFCQRIRLDATTFGLGHARIGGVACKKRVTKSGLLRLIYLCRVIVMGIRLRISPQTFAVLESLLERPTHWRHGYSLSQQTGLPSGTLYPILMRLEKLAWLETRWEEPGNLGRPPRHLYRLTGQGRAWAMEELRAAEPVRKSWKAAYSKA